METVGRSRKILYAVTLFFITLSGFGQMPVFKRYYIADIPGMGWLAQFYITHIIHYTAAIVLIAFAVYVLLTYLFNRSGLNKITRFGYGKIMILTGLILSGALLVIKNLPGVYFPHSLIIVLDLTHLGLCMLLLLLSFCTLFFGKKWIIQ